VLVRNEARPAPAAARPEPAASGLPRPAGPAWCAQWARCARRCPSPQREAP
jgi:hypothetical protein